MQLREGVVKNVMSKDLQEYMEDGWTVLDVRPPTETRKVHIKESVEVPLFTPDTRMDPSSLLKQMSAFGMGGWWLGGTHMIPNARFIADVQAKVCYPANCHCKQAHPVPAMHPQLDACIASGCTVTLVCVVGLNC